MRPRHAGLFHVTTRSIAKEHIFKDDRDYHAGVQILAELATAQFSTATPSVSCRRITTFLPGSARHAEHSDPSPQPSLRGRVQPPSSKTRPRLRFTLHPPRS